MGAPGSGGLLEGAEPPVAGGCRGGGAPGRSLGEEPPDARPARPTGKGAKPHTGGEAARRRRTTGRKERRGAPAKNRERPTHISRTSSEGPNRVRPDPSFGPSPSPDPARPGRAQTRPGPRSAQPGPDRSRTRPDRPEVSSARARPKPDQAGPARGQLRPDGPQKPMGCHTVLVSTKANNRLVPGSAPQSSSPSPRTTRFRFPAANSSSSRANSPSAPARSTASTS